MAFRPTAIETEIEICRTFPDNYMYVIHMSVCAHSPLQKKQYFHPQTTHDFEEYKFMHHFHFLLHLRCAGARFGSASLGAEAFISCHARTVEVNYGSKTIFKSLLEVIRVHCERPPSNC